MIVESNVFESALVETQLEKKLATIEKQAVKRLEVYNKVLSGNEEDPEFLATAAMKRFRENQPSIKINNVEIRIVCSSFSCWERLFSVTKRAFCLVI